jgi:hypothetical protein
MDWKPPVAATSRSGGVRMGDRHLGNPDAEKARARRSCKLS